ncbi:hypothetical protein Poli38472_005165 [Pythium oligandrum]|uniref:Uncharacterized protein n=1 Tax=Pythium oligandrum TaxID=41045 RepID=A0A8K1CI49_PYTOL|nr:hypothetical protein Poli38472_005165 [Pythium oligandrum]|eukprot:TMW62547.1 hypothetical protein Poli38472_005165 [Pythium oligandrum]
MRIRDGFKIAFAKSLPLCEELFPSTNSHVESTLRAIERRFTRLEAQFRGLTPHKASAKASVGMRELLERKEVLHRMEEQLRHVDQLWRQFSRTLVFLLPILAKLDTLEAMNDRFRRLNGAKAASGEINCWIAEDIERLCGGVPSIPTVIPCDESPCTYFCLVNRTSRILWIDKLVVATVGHEKNELVLPVNRELAGKEDKQRSQGRIEIDLTKLLAFQTSCSEFRPREISDLFPLSGTWWIRCEERGVIKTKISPFNPIKTSQGVSNTEHSTARNFPFALKR